jgi:hypothetical protein
MAAKERRPGSVPALREAQLCRWSLAPGERYTAEPDPAGWHEMIAVVEGALRVELAEGGLTIEAAMRFTAARRPMPILMMEMGPYASSAAS